MRSLLPFLSLLLAWTKGNGVLDPAMPFMVNLDPNNLVSLTWGFDRLHGVITFKLAVNTTGWVGMGFSPNGGMAGSDIVIGGFGSNGSYFADYYAMGNSVPLVDTQQSYTLLSMSEREGQTVMTFNRSIQTCDDQDIQITAQPIKLIYAYGTTDAITYHGTRRGTKEVNLLNYMPRTSLPSHSYLDATVNITIPPVQTYYHCKVMNFSNLNTKLHIYQIEPVIENQGVVHHMLLHRCPSFVKETYDKPCYRGDIGDACFGVVAAWGVGGDVLTLPEHAGIPIGGGGSTFYRLEIHYNNPHLEADRKDHSGLRLYYTTKLREHDVGILTAGLLTFSHLFEYNIPPKATQFRSYGVCNTTLMSQLVNPLPDLQMFAVILHTHLSGREVRVGQYRNGEQIDFLGLDENYNFDLQQVTSLGKTKTVKQGDDIVVECTYSTINRNAVTKMGLATTEEMCLAFLFYYPSTKISMCISFPNTTQLSSTNYQMSDIEIAQYESLLKTLPQVQVVTDDDTNLTLYNNGIVRKMMKTPKASCQSNASNTLCIWWILNPGGKVFFLLWFVIMQCVCMQLLV